LPTLAKAIDLSCEFSNAAFRWKKIRVAREGACFRCPVKRDEMVLRRTRRGVWIIPAPWNFPLAIMTGHEAIAGVGQLGNTVVIKARRGENGPLSPKKPRGSFFGDRPAFPLPRSFFSLCTGSGSNHRRSSRSNIRRRGLCFSFHGFRSDCRIADQRNSAAQGPAPKGQIWN